MRYISKSEQETKDIAKKLARETSKHIFALIGELGAGKTVFVQGFAKGLGIQDKIISPTFVLIRQHQVTSTDKTFYHIDLYRLEEEKSILQLGLKDLWSNPNNIVLIEWAEKIKGLLPTDTIYINISKQGGQNRAITIS